MTFSFHHAPKHHNSIAPGALCLSSSQCQLKFVAEGWPRPGALCKKAHCANRIGQGLDSQLQVKLVRFKICEGLVVLTDQTISSTSSNLAVRCLTRRTTTKVPWLGKRARNLYRSQVPLTVRKLEPIVRTHEKKTGWEQREKEEGRMVASVTQ